MGSFYNLDFEKYIFSGKETYVANNKFNISYEYLMLYLEDEVENQRNYSEEFINHVESIKGRKIRFVDDPLSRKYWVGQIHNKEMMVKVNSKVNLYLYLATKKIRKSGLVQNVEKGNFFENCYIKYDGGFSGNRIFFQKAPYTGLAIVDPIKKRLIDFSLLFFNGETKFYINEINSKLAFRSSSFSNQSISEFLLDQGLALGSVNKFLKNVELVKCEYLANDLGIWSMDSFLYLNSEGEPEVYFAHEINFRKTMGYVGYHIGKLLGHSSFRFQLRLLNKDEKGINLSPKNHRYPSSIIFNS